MIHPKLTQTERLVALWATRRGYNCTVGMQERTGGRWLTVHMRHARVTFSRGSLVDVSARRDGKHAQALADEMAGVFALCGYISLIGEGAAAQGRACHADTPHGKPDAAAQDNAHRSRAPSQGPATAKAVPTVRAKTPPPHCPSQARASRNPTPARPPQAARR